ncbi:retrovirus-related pol polyprotein from transposon TNT 1-94 [Tanacetum coccineum]
MTGNQKLFSSYKAYNGGNVIFGSNLRGNIIGKGTISNDSLKIDNVEHVDNLRFNLLSIGQICDNKCRVTFSEHDSEITKDGKVIGRGIRKKGLYVMKLGNKPKDKICLATIDENSTLWHRRLGHANMRLIQSLASKELVRNLPKLKFDQHFCDACKIGKQAHASHKAKNIVSTTRCLELLHMDLFGPSAVRSYGGNRYTLVIVDDYSRYTWTRFLKDKTKAFDQFEIFSKKIQNQLGCTIVSIRTDHGREFDNEVQFGEFCNSNGITHNFSALRIPQSNGMVERKNRILQEMSRTMLNEQSLPQKFWCNAGIDYDETYAPVARLESIRILLAYACALDFKLFQMDVKSAFLNGFINEEVYVAQPPGFIDFEKPDHVYKLKKALYGLKQAPKAWYDRLKAFLIKHEYKMGMVDNTLFTKKKSSNLIIVQIYVDDIIFGSTCQDMCDEFAKIMHDEFEMSMMGELNFFLGLQIKQMEDGIFFNQSKYIKEMLKKFGLEESKPMKTPMSSDTKLTKDEECESVDSTKYQGMIGTTHLGLWYPKGTGIETVVYADSDHVGDYVDRKSTSGRVVSQNFENMSHICAKFKSIDFDCLLDINKQIVPRFVLEFYSQLTFDYNSMGHFVVNFVIQSKSFSITLEEVSQIVKIPFKGQVSHIDMWSLDYLTISVPSKGHYKTTRPSQNVVKSFIQIPRQGQVTRTKNKKTIVVDKNEILTREIQPHMKPWVDIIRENAICLGGHKDHVSACLCHMLYCIETSTNALFKHVVSVFPELAIDHYISHDQVMHPLAPYYERKTRSDRGKKRPRESNASSSSTNLNHPSLSHPLDDTIDENDDELFHSNSSSPSQNISSSSNVVSRIRQNPPHESHNLNTYLSETMNLQTQQRDAYREGLRSIGQALKNMMGGKWK